MQTVITLNDNRGMAAPESLTIKDARPMTIWLAIALYAARNRMPFADVGYSVRQSS